MITIIKRLKELKEWWEDNKRKFTDKRTPLWMYQKLTRGFADYETWSIHHDIMKYTLPRLKEFRKRINTSAHPLNLTSNEWGIILDKIIYFLEYEVECKHTEDENILKNIEEGYKLFNEYWMDFWD